MRHRYLNSVIYQEEEEEEKNQKQTNKKERNYYSQLTERKCRNHSLDLKN